MRYERLTDLVKLAIDLQVTSSGLTLDGIADRYRVSRRTAERLRDAVEAAFGPLQTVDSGERRRHWRLQSTALRGLVRIAPEELAELESAAARLDREGLAERAGVVRALARKLRALSRPVHAGTLDDGLEALMRAEGLAMRPGPRARLEDGLLALLREAISASRRVEFDYLAQGSGKRSRQQVDPHAVLYGNRPYLVGYFEWSDGPRLWRLANVSNARITTTHFERDPQFDLQAYAERAFGTFQEPPFDVVLRFDAGAARDAEAFVFHPSQTVTKNDDGSLTVEFTAGGLDEMCCHLVTWGRSVTVDRPERLRERLQNMCASLARHHASTAQATDASFSTDRRPQSG